MDGEAADQSRRPLRPLTRARLRTIGRCEVVTDPGYCEVHFGRVPALASDLAKFNLSWFLTGPRRAVPAPHEELFALWERYQAAHRQACDGYRRRLFALFSGSAQAGYDDRQWRLLRRSRPTEADLSSVVSHAEVSLHQSQERAGQPGEYEAKVSFVVFWDAHGVTMRLKEVDGRFVVVAWAGIGDL